MKLLISACLVGENCRYDGGNNALSPEILKALGEKYELIPVCPESLGGLPCPREPAEIRGGKVINRVGEDVTAQFEKGARTALDTALENGTGLALLKERSPSCGSGSVYDGSFSKTLKQGDGVTARLLKENGIRVFGESQARELIGGEI